MEAPIVARDIPASLATILTWTVSWGYLLDGFPPQITGAATPWLQFLWFLGYGTLYTVLFAVGPIASFLLVYRVRVADGKLHVLRVLPLLRREYSEEDLRFCVLSTPQPSPPWMKREPRNLRMFFRDGSWCIISGYASGLSDLIAHLQSTGIEISSGKGDVLA
jgi:hypothetical protein